MVRKREVGLGKRKKARGLSPAEKKLFDEYGPRFWNWVCRVADHGHVARIRDTVNPQGLKMRLYYPGSGSDVVVPLLLTNASELILVDTDEDGKLEEKLHEELNSKGWSNCRLRDREVKRVKDGYGRSGPKRVKRTEFEFFFNGKSRNVVFYRAKPEDFLPPELEENENGKEGFDIVFFKKQDEIKNREFLWLWEMLNQDGIFVGMGDFRRWSTFFRKGEVLEVNKNWDYPGSPMMSPYMWTVLSKKKSDAEMAELAHKSMVLARRKRK